MQKYSEMSREQLLALKKELDQQYAEGPGPSSGFCR